MADAGTSKQKQAESQKKNDENLHDLLYQDVEAICSEAGSILKLEFDKSAISFITEIAMKKLTLYGKDLEVFARHAKRSSINVDDVKVLLRRRPALLKLLNLDDSNAPKQTEKAPLRRKSAPVVQDEPTSKKSKDDK